MKVPKTYFYKTRPFREKIGKKILFKKIVFLVPYVGRKTAASGPSGEWTSSDDTHTVHSDPLVTTACHNNVEILRIVLNIL